MKINVPFTKLETIVHLADIHVRLFKRHEEYRESFQTLYKQLRTVDLTNGVIVVAGDIVHAKTDMSPEMLLLASEFLSELADIAPTLIIAGNHDLNLSNMNRLDSLTPIIKNINHTNLHYLKNSGVYEVADTDFAVFSILDGKEEWPDITDCRQDISNKIALFHGPVHGAQTDARYTITNRHVENSTFDGFDMVLLGDIHKYQVLQERTSTQPVIVYSSSLIQQNHGETVNNHGWCLWNVTDRTHIFQELPNRFGYYTLEINDGKLAFPDDIPENVRLRLFTGNADTSVIKKAVASLRKKYNVIELSLNKSKNAGISGTSRRAENITEDVTNLNTQNTLIQDWIERHHENVDDELMKKIIAVNTALHSQVNHDDISRNIHWKPKKFTFSNMFSYGEDNEIDFADMQGLYGIFAQNASGKSSSMDALIFCLYDKTPRAFRGDHIMNNRRDTFECELEFEINEETYHIRRTGTRKKTGDVKVDVLFWKDAPDGSQLSLNGEDRRDTNSNIRNYVGSYEDFVLTALSSQTANALFIDKSHSERKDLLIQFMGLNIFDKMFDIAHDESKELSGALKKFKKTDFTQTLSDIQTKLDTTRIDHEKADMLFTDIKDARELLYTKLKTWQDKKLPLPNIELDLDKLQAKLDTNSKSLVGYEKKKELIANVILSTETQIQDKNTSIQQHNLKELDEDCILYDNLENVLAKGKSALKLTTAKITEKEKFKNKLESYKFNASCDICVENNKSHIDDLRTVTTELGLFTDIQQKQDSAIRDIEAQMIPLKERKALYTQVQTWITETLNLQQYHRNSQSELETVTANIEKIQHQIEQIQKDIELHTINEDNIKHNLDVDTHISHIEFDIKTNKKQAEYLEKNLRELHGELKVLESTKQDIMRQITEAEELEDTFEAYKYYMDAVGRDGVPYELMSRAIPNIEAEINNILTQIAEFTISLEVEGKNIVGKLNYDHERIWPLENSSGMERFISSLAIRVALLNASNLPKSNFMIIDEGLGTLDAENLSSMSVLFGILKNQFDFLIIISHLDSARDMVDKVIEIKREDGFSYINV